MKIKVFLNLICAAALLLSCNKPVENILIEADPSCFFYIKHQKLCRSKPVIQGQEKQKELKITF